MAQGKPNALLVGPKQVNDYLKKIKPEWNFFDNVESVPELYDGLASGEITNDIQILLLVDVVAFDENGDKQDLEIVVSEYAPYCLTLIISYKPEWMQFIKEKIDIRAYAIGQTAPYYFIHPQKPIPDINKAVNLFAREAHELSEEALALICDRRQIDLRIASQKAASMESETIQGDDLSNYDDGVEYLGQVVAVTSSKGGSGKSTIAITLASLLARSSINSVLEGKADRPLKVLLLDLDVRDGQVGFLTANSSPTVLKIRVSTIDRASIESAVIRSNRLKIDLLLAPKRPRLSENTPPEFYLELIERLKLMYDYIILDTSVNYTDPLLEHVAYPIADQIVFVTDYVFTSMFSMSRWIQEVTGPPEKQGMGISRNKIGIVINKIKPDVNMTPERIQQASLKCATIAGIPSCDKLVATATNMQQMDMLLRHKDFFKGIFKLARAVINGKYPLSTNIA